MCVCVCLRPCVLRFSDFCLWGGGGGGLGVSTTRINKENKLFFLTGFLTFRHVKTAK